MEPADKSYHQDLCTRCAGRARSESPSDPARTGRLPLMDTANRWFCDQSPVDIPAQSRPLDHRQDDTARASATISQRLECARRRIVVKVALATTMEWK